MIYLWQMLKLQDSARSLVLIPEDDQSFSKYLQSTTTYIYGIRDCPVPSMTLCVTSDPELEKCVKMKVDILSFKIFIYFFLNKSHPYTIRLL